MNFGSRRLIIVWILILIFTLSIFFFLKFKKTNEDNYNHQESSELEKLDPELTATPTIEPTAIPVSNQIPVKYPEKIKLSQSTLVLYKNQTKQLSVEYVPENIINKKVTWSVDDGNILKITTDGLMTALDTGMATVSVASENKLIDKMVVLVLSGQEEIDKYSQVSD